MRPVLVALVAACSWFAAPYIIAGPDDLEEFFTGTVSTKLAVDAALRGALPFWTPDMALGLPQPLRFHFISHPLAPLCALEDCHQVLRFIASLHILGGVLVTAALVHRITASRVLAAVSGLSLLCASSTVQPTLVDDWAITAVNEASLPLLVYSGLVLLSAAHWRDKLFWTLALGGLAGLLLSMSFPVVVLLLTAAVLAATPRLLARNVGWLCLAGVLTLAIGAGQVAHLLEQVQNAPPGIARKSPRQPSRCGPRSYGRSSVRRSLRGGPSSSVRRLPSRR
jgi:hypothetical protein